MLWATQAVSVLGTVRSASAFNIDLAQRVFALKVEAARRSG
ncbi:hypothetical protein [Deinococcus rubellus]